jgi:hypothetical protein
MTRDRAPRRLDLARRNPTRIGRFESKSAEIQGRPTFSKPMNASLMGLAILAPLRTQHGCLIRRFAPAALVARRLSLNHPPFLSHWIVSENLALENPNLDATHTVGRLSGAVSEIDIGA